MLSLKKYFSSRTQFCVVKLSKGNPTSSCVTFNLFVKPALKMLSGQKPNNTIIQARLDSDIHLDARPEYHRCTLGKIPSSSTLPDRLTRQSAQTDGFEIQKKDFSKRDSVPVAISTGSQCSANINSCSKAHGLIIVPQKTEKSETITKGSILNVMLFQDI